jgi:hypothetical protein
LLRPFANFERTYALDGVTINGEWRYVRLLAHLGRIDELRANAARGHDASTFYLRHFH